MHVLVEVVEVLPGTHMVDLQKVKGNTGESGLGRWRALLQQTRQRAAAAPHATLLPKYALLHPAGAAKGARMCCADRPPLIACPACLPSPDPPARPHSPVCPACPAAHLLPLACS
jgi:hypothetical protein